MPEIVSIGPFRADGTLLTAILSLVVGLAALSLWIRQKPEVRQGPWIDLLITASVITLIGWKVGFLLRDPSLLWTRPSAILIMRGNTGDVILGLTAAVIYLLVIHWRKRIAWMEFLNILPFALLPGWITWNALSEFPYRLIYAIVFAVVYVWIIRQQTSNVPEQGDAISSALLGIAIGGLAASLFAPYPPGYLPDLTWGLTSAQWLLIGLGVLGAVIPRIQGRHQENETTG
ncbi:hypothetical protein [Paenibacillus mendelii]|uniref:Prolipoprotein diacylglyceryl transferase n=1 Tax=Paenibacillus mendelii TaxID=206163 RepID=A0ABV6J9P4_9BACL|nr:hypothetical protein [Paenibacillus mendelii]MCQ6559543.1 hypothetical protein [Paenibacillus mendelii]